MTEEETQTSEETPSESEETKSETEEESKEESKDETKSETEEEVNAKIKKANLVLKQLELVALNKAIKLKESDADEVPVDSPSKE